MIWAHTCVCAECDVECVRVLEVCAAPVSVWPPIPYTVHTPTPAESVHRAHT